MFSLHRVHELLLIRESNLPHIGVVLVFSSISAVVLFMFHLLSTLKNILKVLIWLPLFYLSVFVSSPVSALPGGPTLCLLPSVQVQATPSYHEVLFLLPSGSIQPLVPSQKILVTLSKLTTIQIFQESFSWPPRTKWISSCYRITDNNRKQTISFLLCTFFTVFNKFVDYINIFYQNMFMVQMNGVV